MKSEKELFEGQKKATLDCVELFLKQKPKAQGIRKIKATYPKKIVENLKIGDLGAALKGLERIREEKTGVILSEEEKDGVKVSVRDARGAKEPPVRGAEAFAMQYINAIRGALDIAEIEGKEGLRKELNAKACQFYENISKIASTGDQEKDQKAFSAFLKAEEQKLGKFLEEKEISDSFRKLNSAKDFQNFNDEHRNIVTISSVTDKTGGKHTVVEAETAFKGLSDEQKKEFEKIRKGEKPGWYEALSPMERGLCQKYADDFVKGDRVIPTQLRGLPGIRNAFEKTTAVYENDKLETLHSVKHGGTLASLSKDSGAAETLTDQNVKRAKLWIGEGKTLHCNILNSGSIGAGEDPKIAARTKKGIEDNGGELTATPFNAFRYIGATSNLSGSKKFLEEFSDALLNNCSTLSRKEKKKIQNLLKPKGFFGRIFRWNAKKEIERLKGIKIYENFVPIFKELLDLRNAIEKAAAALRPGDRNNASLEVSTRVNLLTSDPTNKGFFDYETFVACASGKDRTGLAMHDQTARALAKRLNMDPKDLDEQILKSGHTAYQAGGLYAGGGTIGCYGTKAENRAGIPAGRRKGLRGIVEISADTNKIKGKNKNRDPKINQDEEAVRDRYKTLGKESKRRQSFVKPSSTPPIQEKNTKITIQF